MRKFEDLTDDEILKLTLIANGNDVNNEINPSDWKITREPKKRSIYVRYKKGETRFNKLWFTAIWGGFSVSLLVPHDELYSYSLSVPFHLFLDYLSSIGVDYRT